MASGGPERTKDWIPGGRKFSLCVMSILVGAVLCLSGHLDGSAFVTLILGTTGAFIAGNVAQDYRPPRDR